MIVPNPVWKEMLICTGGDTGQPDDEVYLPYFETVVDVRRFAKALCTEVAELWQCKYCGGYHYSSTKRSFEMVEAPVTGPRRHRVHLSPEIAELARGQGLARRADSAKRGYQDRNWDGWTTESQYQESDVQARGAEWAAHVFLRMPIGATIGDFKKPDLGQLIQIRSSVDLRNNLIVRESDAREHYFVLVLGKIPDFEIVGFMSGAEAKQPKYWRKDWTPRPAYLVPQNQLKDIETCPAVTLYRIENKIA